MQPIIAVESNLTNVIDHLQENNYSPVELPKADLDNVDAVIISGQDDNTTGMMNSVTEAPVFNAEGISASQIQKLLDQKLKPHSQKL